jgi:DNA polymerase
MSDPAHPGPEELGRQVRQHLDSLREAGVEWLPVSRDPVSWPAAATTPAATPQQPTPPPPPAPGGSAPSLFDVPLDPAPAAGTDAAPPLSLEERRVALEVLAQEVAGCTRCKGLAATRTQTVFGVGPPGVELCFLGEAPGGEEDRTGEPFVGPAGQLLNRIIAACGMKREEVYICNILRCRPPGNRQPLPDEANNCRPWLDRTLELVRPKFICCLGATAAQNLLGMASSIGRLRGKFFEYRGSIVTCTYHPSYLLRNPAAKKDVWEDMKKLLARMGRPVPRP